MVSKFGKDKESRMAPVFEMPAEGVNALEEGDLLVSVKSHLEKDFRWALYEKGRNGHEKGKHNQH